MAKRGDMTSGVYCFIHHETLRCYVGSSIDVWKRKVVHINMAKNGSTNHFRRHLRELGYENFDFELLEKCDASIRLEREKFWIIFLGAFGERGFNSKSDPTKGWNYDYTPEVRRKISIAHKGHLRCIGRKHSLETRLKISVAHKGKPKGIGRVFSEETKRKISESHKAGAFMVGKKLSEETKAKIGLKSKGNQHRLGSKQSPETRSKMSQSQTERWKTIKCLKE